MEKQEKAFSAVWGRWSGKRELVRGLFHFSVGFIGWILLHPLYLDSDLITFLLCTVSFTFIVLEVARLAINKWHNTEWYAKFLHWVNNRLVKKFFTRETEIHQQTTAVTSLLGLSFAWIIGERWVCSVVILYFSLIDPLAKLGKYWPIVTFEKGLAEKKSLGGALFGLLGGLLAIGVVFLVNLWVVILPPKLNSYEILSVFLAGLLAASFFELIGKKLDNFLIPACSAVVMTVLVKFFFS